MGKKGVLSDNRGLSCRPAKARREKVLPKLQSWGIGKKPGNTLPQGHSCSRIRQLEMIFFLLLNLPKGEYANNMNQKR